MPDDQFQFFKDHFPSKNNFKASEIKKIWNSFHFSSNSMQCQSELHKNFWLLFQSLMRVAEDTVFENCKKISRACIIWDFSDMIFNPLWEVWLSLPKNLQSYARIAKSRSTFLDREKSKQEVACAIFLNLVDDIIIAKMPSNDYAIQGQQY